MKFSVTKEKLLEGLQQVQNVVSTRTSLPILSNVLLQANGNEVHLTTTDLDVGVRGSFEAQVEKDGATTLPARRLFKKGQYRRALSCLRGDETVVSSPPLSSLSQRPQCARPAAGYQFVPVDPSRLPPSVG